MKLIELSKNSWDQDEFYFEPLFSRLQRNDRSMPKKRISVVLAYEIVDVCMEPPLSFLQLLFTFTVYNQNIFLQFEHF